MLGWAAGGDCADGRIRNELTYGHCCWSGQTWSSDELRCVGLAECPAGRMPSDDGEDCVKAECGPDRVDTAGGCCWRGQTWSEKKSRCIGVPQCPADHVARGARCLPVEPLPKAETLPYIPVKPTDYIEFKAGHFSRGSPRRELGRYRNERNHTVALTRKVLVKRTEVTQDEWRQLIPHNPSLFVECGGQCPVERVNWYEALSWLNRLSKAEGLDPCYELNECSGQLGGACRVPSEGSDACLGDYTCVVQFKGLDCAGYRLPTEAEWEYVARSGTSTSTYGGNLSLRGRADSAVLDPIAWHSGNSQVTFASGRPCANRSEQRCGTHPVAELKPTPWGHHDMLGNVMEWVWDGYGRYPSRSAVNPVQHLGVERVIRGGSWASQPRLLRSAVRSRLSPLGRNSELGFRAVRTVVLQNQAPPESAETKAVTSPSRPESGQTEVFVGPPTTAAPGGSAIRIGGDEEADEEELDGEDPVAPSPKRKRPKKSADSTPIKLKVQTAEDDD